MGWVKYAASAALALVAAGRAEAAPGAWSYTGFPPRHAVGVGPGYVDSRLAVGLGAVWTTVYGASGRWLVRADVRTARIRRSRLRPTGTDVAVGAGSVWTLDQGVLRRIDPRTGRMMAAIRLPAAAGQGPGIVRFGGGRIWASSWPEAHRRGDLWAVDPATNEVVAHVLTSYPAVDLTVAHGRVWLGGVDGVVRVVDAARHRLLAALRVGPYPIRVIRSGPSGVWALDGTTLVRIDPDRMKLAKSIRLVAFPAENLAVGRHGVFLLDGAGRLRGLDPEAGWVGSPTPIRGFATSLTSGFHSLWMLVGRDNPRLVRVNAARATGGARRAPWCTASALRGTIGDSQPAVGRLVGSVIVRNVSRRSCTLSGAPFLRIVDERDRPLPLLVHRVNRPAEAGDVYPQGWPYVTVRPHGLAVAGYEQYNACGARGRVFYEVRLPHGGGRLRFPGEWGGRCDAPHALAWMYLAAYEPG